MEILEHNAPALFTALLDHIKTENDESWGIVRLKKSHLKAVTDEAFLHAIHPVMQKAAEAHVFFIDNKRIYLVWQGDKKSIYKKLRTLIGTTLAQPGLVIDPAVMAAYIDPLARGGDLKVAFKHNGEEAERLLEKATYAPLPSDMNDEDENETFRSGKSTLAVTALQTEPFREVCYRRACRQQLQILVVEDQIFSQKLLCEILRGARIRNNNETPLIDTAPGIQEAWKIYIKKAPDMVFIDLGLTDGSGHALARAIKELDTRSYVIIVTANDYEEELDVARQNNVDGFIAKPYNKKQILDCVDRYVGMCRGQVRSVSRGSAS